MLPRHDPHWYSTSEAVSAACRLSRSSHSVPTAAVLAASSRASFPPLDPRQSTRPPPSCSHLQPEYCRRDCLPAAAGRDSVEVAGDRGEETASSCLQSMDRWSLDDW